MAHYHISPTDVYAHVPLDALAHDSQCQRAMAESQIASSEEFEYLQSAMPTLPEGMFPSLTCC
jgi:hypothetical protein